VVDAAWKKIRYTFGRSCSLRRADFEHVSMKTLDRREDLFRDGTTRKTRRAVSVIYSQR